jgi:hypothetical protein
MLGLFWTDLVRISRRGSFLGDPIVLDPEKRSVILYIIEYNREDILF